jgi:hypothetical protein
MPLIVEYFKRLAFTAVSIFIVKDYNSLFVYLYFLNHSFNYPYSGNLIGLISMMDISELIFKDLP